MAEKRLVVRWTAPKGFATVVLFFVLVLFFEFLLVYSFLGFGLIDQYVWVGNFQFFTLVISPLFHVLPLTVVVVLVVSWVYLTRYTVYVPARAEAAKRPLTRRELERRRFKAWRRFSRRIDRRLQGFSSYVFKRLYLASAAVRSGFVVLMVFLALSVLLLVVVYPDLIYNLAVGLYQGNPSLLGFVRGTASWARGFGDVFAGVFVGVAPGFYKSLVSTGASLTGSIVSLDVAGKYVLSQNVAAWASALVALGYGTYVSSRRQRKR